MKNKKPTTLPSKERTWEIVTETIYNNAPDRSTDLKDLSWILWEWFKRWKPIHLCWLFYKYGWKIPPYLIGMTTTSTSSSSSSTRSTSTSSSSVSSSSSSSSSISTSTTVAISWNNYLFVRGGGALSVGERIRGQTYKS